MKENASRPPGGKDGGSKDIIPLEPPTSAEMMSNTTKQRHACKEDFEDAAEEAWLTSDSAKKIFWV